MLTEYGDSYLHKSQVVFRALKVLEALLCKQTLLDYEWSKDET